MCTGKRCGRLVEKNPKVVGTNLCGEDDMMDLLNMSSLDWAIVFFFVCFIVGMVIVVIGDLRAMRMTAKRHNWRG